jgi:stearoyl-CoA desaturase (delta-9 desaturase)
VAHVFGRRPYETEDTSRNSLFVALLTGGEGWHNNHHRYPSSARQGFRWWQIDTTYYGLRVLELCGVVRDLRKPPRRIIEEGKRTRTSVGPASD